MFIEIVKVGLMVAVTISGLVGGAWIIDVREDRRLLVVR